MINADARGGGGEVSYPDDFVAMYSAPPITDPCENCGTRVGLATFGPERDGFPYVNLNDMRPGQKGKNREAIVAFFEMDSAGGRARNCFRHIKHTPERCRAARRMGDAR